MALVNFDYLTRTFDHDWDIIFEVTAEFASTAPGQLEKLADSLKQKNLTEAGRLFHSLKGSLKLLGADEGSEIAYSGELTSRDGDLDLTLSNFEKLQDMIATIIRELDSLNGRNYAPK